MGKFKKTVLTLLATFLLSLLVSPPLPAEERIIELEFGGQSFSALVRGAPLGAVIKKMKEELQKVWFKIWLKKSKKLLNEKISVEFDDLPIRKGMERIFSEMNHSIVFNKHGKLLGIFLVGKPLRAWGSARRGSIASRRRIPRRGPGRYPK